MHLEDSYFSLKADITSSFQDTSFMCLINILFFPLMKLRVIFRRKDKDYPWFCHSRKNLTCYTILTWFFSAAFSGIFI